MVLLKLFTEPPFFFKMAAISRKMSTLSDFNENWYLGVIWRGEHDGTIEILFRATIFFFKMAAILQKFQLCPISMKIDILGYIDLAIMMVLWKIFFEIATILHKCHLCPILRKNYSWECLMWWIWWYYRNIFPSCQFFSEWLPCRINVIFVWFQRKNGCLLVALGSRWAI